jgi:hypothetical protein
MIATFPNKPATDEEEEELTDYFAVLAKSSRETVVQNGLVSKNLDVCIRKLKETADEIRVRTNDRKTSLLKPLLTIFKAASIKFNPSYEFYANEYEELLASAMTHLK